MQKRWMNWSISIALSFIAAFSATAIVSAATKAKVTYIASEAIYINAGTNAGIEIGDTLAVTKQSDTLAVLVVTNVSGSSAACELIDSRRELKVGDILQLAKYATTPKTGKSYEGEVVQDEGNGKIKRSRRARDAQNALSGGISLENLYRKDQTGSRLSSNQAGLRSRIKVKNISGSGIQFEMRHRSRLYQRSRSLRSSSVTGGSDEWSHQIYSFGLSYGDDNSTVSWGVGRMLAPHVRGMGYIDGGYVIRRVNERLHLGIAAGVTPNAQTSSIQLNRRKLGAYARYVAGDASKQRVSVTASLTSVLESFSVSRDFLYLQSSYSRGRWLSLSQSFEVEFNRGWRYELAGKRFDVSNYYGTANFNVMTSASVYITYDARKNIRRFDNADTPDSLFDGSTHRGFRGGFRLNNLKNLRFYGNLGVRLRQNAFGNNTFGSLGARINRLPRRGHSLALSMSFVRTQFTTGYRPNITYRFPIGRQTRFNVTASAYSYNTASTTITNFYLDIGASRPLGRRYFLTGSYRQYFDSNLQSAELYTEIGLRL